MRSQWTGLLVVGLTLLILVGDCPVAAEPSTEPVYKGKSLSAWMAAIKRKDGRYDERVIWTLGEMGSDAKPAVPLLIEALGDDTARFTAIAALGDIGPDAAAAVPKIMDTFLNESHDLRFA